MSLLPESASFAELVQDCFLAHRGSGLMLSALDAALVMEWAEADVPFEVVARGIRKAAEKALWDARPGEPALRSLRACRREVEAEIKKFRARSVGAHAEAERASEPPRSFEEERHRKLKAVVAKLGREDPSLQPATRRLLASVLARPAADLRAADVQEEVVLASLIRARPFAERLKLFRDARALAGDDPLSSPQARKLSRRFHRHALIRRALQLPAFW